MAVENKKRKLEPPAASQQPAYQQCGFYMEKKKRVCKMQRKAEQKYCSEHMVMETPATEHAQQQPANVRIPCPNDSRHTVWSDVLEKHLRRCKAVVVMPEAAWFARDINATLKTKDEGEKDEVEKEEQTEKEEKNDELLFAKYIPIISQLTFPLLALEKAQHSGLNERLAKVHNKKHAIQQSSLIGKLKQLGLLSGSYTYLEFGCGKAELSRFVNLSIIEDKAFELTAPSFGFIDRGVNRMKMDSKIVKDYENMPQKPEIVRDRIDIKHLDLDVFMDQFKHKKHATVCISKHLCGAATDLTLKCILNSQIVQNHTFKGLVVAMCCRHVCDYDLLLPQSRTYLSSKGFGDVQSFKVLKKMASWAVCGRKDHIGDSDGADHPSKLTILERENMGLVARRIIDESRVYALREILGQNYQVRINWYIESDITLENVFLSITKAEQQS